MYFRLIYIEIYLEYINIYLSFKMFIIFCYWFEFFMKGLWLFDRVIKIF